MSPIDDELRAALHGRAAGLTPEARQEPAPVSYALDPTDPWEFRGVPVDEGTHAAIQREYATRTRAGEVLVTPLFAQVYEPSQQLEVVFLAEVDGEYRWAVAVATESGPEFVHDMDLFESDRLGLAMALPGDEVARLLVVAAPGTTVEYAPSGEALAPLAEIAGGVGTAPLERGLDGDYYAVTTPCSRRTARPSMRSVRRTPA